MHNISSIAPSLKLTSAALLSALIALTTGAQTGKPVPEAAGHKEWRANLLAAHASQASCQEAVFPSTTWKDVPCGTPPKPPAVQHEILSMVRPLDEKATGSYVLVSNQPIFTASGTLPVIENVTSVIGFNNTVQNTFNLQINTDSTFPRTAPGSVCKALTIHGSTNQGSRNSGCTGWLQFVYDSGGSINIQSWGLQYKTIKTASCPSNLELHDTALGCGTRTASFTLPQPFPKLSDLAGAVLTGQVFKDQKGNIFDEVSLTIGTKAYKTTQSRDITGAFGNWKTAEFNVFGNSAGDESVFNSGSLISVELTANGGTGGSGTCAGEDPVTGAGTRAGSTGETTNLTLVAPCRVTSGPGISFVEGVAPIIQSLSPRVGSAGGVTGVTVTAAQQVTNGVTMVYGFNPNVLIKVGASNALGVSCTPTTCSFTTPGDKVGSFDEVTVQNLFRDGTPGPASTPLTPRADLYGYIGPVGCSLAVLSCPAAGGAQEYQVSCPGPEDFRVNGVFQSTGSSFVGSEAGAHQATAVSACLQGTTDCSVFTTTSTETCPITPPVHTRPITNCRACTLSGRACKPVPGGFVCVGDLN